MEFAIAAVLAYIPLFYNISRVGTRQLPIRRKEPKSLASWLMASLGVARSHANSVPLAIHQPPNKPRRRDPVQLVELLGPRLLSQRRNAPFLHVADRPVGRSDRVVFHGSLRHRFVAPGRAGRAGPVLGLASWPWHREKEGSRRSRRRLNAAPAQPTFTRASASRECITRIAERISRCADRRGCDRPERSTGNEITGRFQFCDRVEDQEG